MDKTIKNNKGWVAGLLTAVAASLCCITPVLALLGGASGLASSFSWMEPFRPFLIGLTVLVFAFAWYQKLKPLLPRPRLTHCFVNKKK
jgi:mercuric ion transport protein